MVAERTAHADALAAQRTALDAEFQARSEAQAAAHATEVRCQHTTDWILIVYHNCHQMTLCPRHPLSLSLTNSLTLSLSLATYMY